MVHSVDDFKIAKRLNDQRPLDLPPLNICLQLNIIIVKQQNQVLQFQISIHFINRAFPYHKLNCVD